MDKWSGLRSQIYAARNGRRYFGSSPWMQEEEQWLNEQIRDAERNEKEEMARARQAWRERRAELYRKEEGDPACEGLLTHAHLELVQRLLHSSQIPPSMRRRATASATRVLRALNLSRQKLLKAVASVNGSVGGGSTFEEGMEAAEAT